MRKAYLDSASQDVNQHLPLQVIRVALSSDVIPEAGFCFRTELILLLFDFTSLVVCGAEGPNGVHAVAISLEILAASLSNQKLEIHCSNILRVARTSCASSAKARLGLVLIHSKYAEAR